MPDRPQFRATSTRAFSVVMIVVGLAMIVRTLAAGGGALATGLILGLLFIGAGAGRLYLQLRG
jgi:hypothetical protein